MTSENEFHATITNNGYLRSGNNLIQNQKSKINAKQSAIMDEVTGALLSDNNDDTINANKKIEIKKTTNRSSPQPHATTSPTSASTTPSPIAIVTPTSNATKTSFVHFGPGPVTTSSIEPNCIYKEAKIRNRIVIFLIGSTLLGVAVGILSVHMTQSQFCSTGGLFNYLRLYLNNDAKCYFFYTFVH